MVEINQSICNGCGACVKDCFVRNISLVHGQAKVSGNCMKCGHCVAVCPKEAVSIPEYTMEDVTTYQQKTFDIPAENLLNFMKFRRSIRQFKRKTVEDEKIRLIIEAGRHTPTGGNQQNVRYIVVQEQLQLLRKYIISKLNKIAIEAEDGHPTARFATRFRTMYENYLKDSSKEDELFFHSEVLLLVVSDSTLPAALASTAMELQANALGLGCLYSGFSTSAINADADCRALLNLSDKENAVTAIVIGYPDVTYQRTAPRKAPEITML